MKRFVALLGLLLATSLLTPVAAAAPAKWATTVFALVPAPGYPAYVFAHRNGRVYAGSYVSGSQQPSKVFEWSANGTLRRSWTVPGQVLGDHGVQVAHQTRNGKLVLLETSTASVLVLDIRHRQVHPRRPTASGRRAELRDLGRPAATYWSPTTPRA